MGIKTLLVATDNPKDINLIRNYAEQNGFGSVFVNNFNDLLATLGMTKDISLLVLDFPQYQAEAMRVIKMLRGMAPYKSLPILTICSPSMEESSFHELLAAGCDDFLRRPLYPWLIGKRCEAVLDSENKTVGVEESHFYVMRNLFRLVLHDISNLLINFEIFMNSINRPMNEKAKVKRILRAKSTLNEIRALLKNAKMLDAIRSQKLIPKLQTVDLGQCIAEISEIYRDRLGEKQLSLEGNWQHQRLFVKSEAVSLKHQVLGNLLTNAIKFSHPGSPINITVEDFEPNIRIKIQDFGVGISPQNIKNLFREGELTSRAGTQGEVGTGYGMPLVFQFISAYNGKIDVISEEQLPGSTNHGTTFLITLEKAVA